MELTKIRGISEKRQEELNKLGIFDTADMVRFFPRTYLDLRSVQPLRYVYHNDIVLTVGKVISEPIKRFFRRLDTVKVSCEQEGFIFNIIWYNQSYVASKLKVGEEYLFYGRIRVENDIITLTNPSFECCEKAFRLQGIVPQYKIKSSLNQKIVRDACRLAVDIEKPSTLIPDYLVKKYQLSSLYWAFREVHNPSSFENLKRASDRIAVEEYFALISAFKYIKGGREQIRINKYSTNESQLDGFIKNNFNFEFTEGQKSAVEEIFNDLTSVKVMNRLLQGDVGSGKTAVANCAVFMAISSGYQVAMLAPTEVLAQQNFKILKKLFPKYNISLLTGSLSAKEKREVKNGLKDGSINVVCGTHAILEKDVEFKNLSLCICDEQHRFGVAQRSNLSEKGLACDILVMSATPIPRTLSLIFYGDLDITTIKDKPKNRIPVQTGIVPSEKYNDMLKYIKEEAEKGRQIYFVAPKIDGDEEGELISVTELYNELLEKLPSLKIGLMHGRMKEKEKIAVMDSFKEGQIHILVSTTVIEVGVDVPNACIMIIYNAERFGLSQLHQLRGRVGRGDIKSYCFLLTQKTSGEAIERLKVLRDNSDGFKISEYDFKLRGSGDFMGEKQSGKFMSELGALSYGTEAIFLAKKISDEAFIYGMESGKFKEIALSKYARLKDVVLN